MKDSQQGLWEMHAGIGKLISLYLHATSLREVNIFQESFHFSYVNGLLSWEDLYSYESSSRFCSKGKS